MNLKHKIQKLEKVYKKFHTKMQRLAERQQDAISKAVKKIEKKQLKKLREGVK